MSRAFDRLIGGAAQNPLVRGGLMIGAGIVIGNLVGFFRVAVTAYFLGTRAAADALAVAIGPIDTLNGVLTNTMVFAFVPFLMLRDGGDRIAVFRQANRLFNWVFGSLTVVILLFAPWLMRLMAPGLTSAHFSTAVNILRITSFSTLAAGSAAIQSALLFTQRRFGPSAFYQANLNLFTIAGAILLWRVCGIYGFAIGYTCGACFQFALVSYYARPLWTRLNFSVAATPIRELIAKPGSFLIYAGLIALNVIVTRAYATQAGPGMAAAFDYSMRCVNVVVAYLVSPVSNSLLPEIARLRSRGESRAALRIIDRTISLAAVAAVVSCVIGIALRQPVIALLFQRGSFTAESTRLVSGVFLGFAPSLIGLSLLELTSRSLFALNRPSLPMLAAGIPVVVNVVFSIAMRTAYPARAMQPEYIGLGASLGLLAAFAILFAAIHSRRRVWHEADVSVEISKLQA